SFCPTGHAVCLLSLDELCQPSRRIRIHWCPRADRARLSRTRFLGHGNLHAAVLSPLRAGGGTCSRNVPLSHIARSARQGSSEWISGCSLPLGISRWRRGDATLRHSSRR